MESTKPIYASRTVWGAVVAIVAGVAQVAGHALAPEDQLALINLLTQIGELSGAGLALWGRIAAKHTIG